MKFEEDTDHLNKKNDMKIIDEVANGVNDLLAIGDISGRYKGNDNSGKPKLEYLKKVVSMTDEELRKECESKIWLSAYASNNLRSDYHWHCDCCYDECERRGKETLYKEAYKSVSSGL